MLWTVYTVNTLDNKWENPRVCDTWEKVLEEVFKRAYKGGVVAICPQN